MTGSAVIRIESHSRWDALALARSLRGQNWHLVQTGPDRWYVCIPREEQVDDLPEELLGLVRSWLDERALAEAVVHLPDRERVVEREPGMRS